MRFLNRPQIDNNENTQRAYLNTVTNVFGITGQLALNKDINTQTFLKASTSLTSNYTLTLPPDSGTDGQVLTTDGTGVLRFTNPDVGGNRIFVSAKNGVDTNDGFNKPVRSIKRAAQIAASFTVPTIDPTQGAIDAKALLLANKLFIQSEVMGFISYCVTNGLSPFTTGFRYNRALCKRDIGYIIDSAVYDLTFGGNAQCIYSGRSYFSRSATVVPSNQKLQSIASFNYAKYVAAAVLNNTALTSNGTYTRSSYQSENKTDDPSNINNPPIAAPTSVPQVIDLSKSPQTVDKNKIAAGFDLISSILDNGLAWSKNPANLTQVNPLYTPLPITIQVATGEYYEDNPIITPDRSTIVGDDLRSVIIRPNNPGKDMFRVRNGMYMTGFTFRDALDQVKTNPTYGKPISTFGYSVSFDDVNDYTIDRGAYGGLSPTIPVVSISPYIQNCSIISFLGGNGCLIDGSKVQTPNIPLIQEEVENPATGPAPTQGKSMVANAFTMVSFGGTGWKVINDAYCQLVSCFQLFMLNGVYAESGGYCSVTNSATNFGINALRSAGFSPTTFDFDKGIIANFGSDNQTQTVTSLGHGRIPVNHYVLKFKSNVDGSDITSSHKATSAISFNINAATDVNQYSNQITEVAHGLTSLTSVLYINNNTDGSTDIPGLISGDIYYVYRAGPDTFQLYYDNSLTKIVTLNVSTGSLHTFTKNIEEFYVNEIIDSHNTYQTLTLASSSHTFIPGKIIYGNVNGASNSAYVYSWNPSTKELVVSLINVSSGGNQTKIPFIDSSTITSDAGVSISITVNTVASVINLYTATYTVRSTISDNSIIDTDTLKGNYVWLNKPSIVNSSSHTWEYAGSGTDYNALPDNGGKTIKALQEVAELPGRVYTSGTNELGDFTIGNFITAYNRTGNIVFSNKVTVSELTALKLSLSDISITAISTDIGLGDNEQGGALNTRLTTQLAQRSFMANRLGDFIDKHISTSSIPAAIVQLNGNGQINADLIPPIRGFNTHLINSYYGRLSLYEKIPVEEALGGDVISETYIEKVLTLSGNVTVAAGDKITQATTNAYGYVKTNVTGSNTIILELTSATAFDYDTSTPHNYNLTKATMVSNFVTTSSLSVYVTGVVSQTNSDSYYLTTDNTSQFLRLDITKNYRFTIGNSVSAAVNGAVGTITDYRCGFITGLNSGSLVSGSGYYYDSSPSGVNTYYNVALTGGTGKYTSASGATSSSLAVYVTSTTGLEIGMLVTVTAGTGAFVSGTTVTNIVNATQFTVSQTPTTPLSGGASVVRGDATGAYADISINSSGNVYSVNLYRGGVGYQTGDVLTANAANIGGTVTVPFSIPVSSIEKRLYIDISNGVRFTATNINYNYVQDNNATSFTLTLDATTAISFNADATPSGAVNYTNNTIYLPGHTFSNGDPVNYSINGNTSIGNFNDGDTYYVGLLTGNNIELYVDYAKVLKKTFGSSATGTHILTRRAVDFSSNHFVKIGHGLETGQSVKISNFTNTAFTAISDGATDYGIKLTLNINTNLSAGAVVTQASSGASGTVLNTVVNSGYVTLRSVSGTFDTTNTLSSGVSLGVRPTVVATVPIGKPIASNSYWFVGSKTVNSFTLHQYSVDALSSILGASNNELDIMSAGIGNVTFSLQNAVITSVVNTSSKTLANYSSLSNTTIDAGGIISGTINTTRLGSGTANSTNYLRGDSVWHTVTESISKGPNSPISISGNYISEPITVTGISGTITSSATVTTITGISSTSQLFTGMILTRTSGAGFGGTATITSINSNTAISIITDSANTPGAVTFTASSNINKYYGNATLDIVRVDSNAAKSGTYSNIGIASFDTTYFAIGPNSGTGTVSGQVSIIPLTINAALTGGETASNFHDPALLSATVPINKGGTNLASYAQGVILYAPLANTLAGLSIGNPGYVLAVNASGTLPQWTGYTGSNASNIVYSDNPTFTTAIKSGSSSFDLVNTTATTVNFAGFADTANIGYLGSNASTTNISTGPVKSTTIKTVNIGTGAVTGSTTNINIGSGIGGTTTINSGTVVGANTTQNLYNTTATTMNFAGAATTIGIGAATGTITLGNPILTGTTLATFNMNGTSPIAIVTSTASSTANVFNTNATTGNLFGAATTIGIGAATGTFTVNNITISHPNATSMSMDGISPSITTASIGTASVFNTNATIGNLLGAAPYVNIGKSSITSALTFDGSSTAGWTGNTPTASAAQGNPINSFLVNATTAYRSTAFTTLVGRTIQFDAYISATSSMDFYFGTNSSGSGNVLELNSGTGASDLSTCSSYSRGSIVINNTTNQFTSGSWVTVTIAITSTSAAGIAIYWGSTAKTFTRNQFVDTGDYIGFQNVSGTCYIDNIKIYNGVYTPDQITSGAILTTNAGSVVGANTTQNLYNTVATTVNFAGAATTINVGANTGTLTIGNATITGTNATTFNMNGASPSIVTSSTTASVFNTNATTGNLFGAATSLTIGYGSTAASTTNISTGAVASGTTKTVNIGTGGASGSTTNINIGSSTGSSTTTITLNTSLIGTVVTTAITSTPAVAVDSWALATYRSAKYILQVTCTAVSSGSNLNTYQVSEVLVIHNGTTATMIEYGTIKTTNDLATFTVDCNSSSNGLVRLLAVAANASDTITVKLYKTLMVV
jgi:hypothetical protein